MTQTPIDPVILHVRMEQDFHFHIWNCALKQTIERHSGSTSTLCHEINQLFLEFSNGSLAAFYLSLEKGEEKRNGKWK
jgi:hypothetical protein